MGFVRVFFFFLILFLSGFNKKRERVEPVVDGLNDIYRGHIEEDSRDDVFVILIRNRPVNEVDDVDRDHRAWDRDEKECVEHRAFRSFLFGSEEPDGVSDENGSSDKSYPGEPGNFGVAHADDTGEGEGRNDGSDNREEDELSAINEFCFG